MEETLEFKILKYLKENGTSTSDELITILGNENELNNVSKVLYDKKYIEIESFGWSTSDSGVPIKRGDRPNEYTILFEGVEYFNKLGKEILEKELSKTNLRLAKKMLKDFPRTKVISYISIIIGICLALLEIAKSTGLINLK